MIDTKILEGILIGSALSEKEAYPSIRHLVKPDDFSSSFHREVWEAFGELYLNGQPIDAIMLYHHMGLTPEQNYTLHSYMIRINSTANLKYHCQCLIDAIVTNSQEAAHSFAASNPKVLKTEEWREKEAKRLEKERRLAFRFKEADGINHQIKSFADHVDKARELEGLSGIPTGNPTLDRVTGGWQNEYIVIAARPSMGKTAKMLDYVYHACKSDRAVYVASLEMKASELIGRLTSRITGYNSMHFKTSKAKELDEDKLREALDEIGEWDLVIDDRPRMSMDTISAAAKDAKRQFGKLDIIFIDHLQIVGTEYKSGRSRVDEMTEISGRVQMMVKEFNCPVVVMCQLSRECEKRSDKRPVPSDLRDSGAIEQDAGVIMALYRPTVYYENVYDDPDYKDSELQDYHDSIMELIIRKNRNGETKSFRELVDLKTGAFVEAPRVSNF